MSSTAIPKVVPAQLSFLAVYNPSLGTSDETFHQQIVFYYSKAAKARSKLSHGDTKAAAELREQENEKLRQVGLAQGMVGFAKSFSNGDAVDSVETQKSRIVLRELEDGWWILAVSSRISSPRSSSKSNDLSSPSISRNSPPQHHGPTRAPASTNRPSNTRRAKSVHPRFWCSSSYARTPYSGYIMA